MTDWRDILTVFMTHSDNAAASASRSSQLCTQCGICCQAMFNFVRVADEEVERLSALGFDIIRDHDGKNSFLFPCPKLRGTTCGVYENRPAACRAFRCKILKDYEAGVLEEADAKHIIAEGRELIDRARASFTGSSDDIQPRRLANLERGSGATGGRAIDDDSALAILRLTSLHRFLDKHFRTPDERFLGEMPVGKDLGAG